MMRLLAFLAAVALFVAPAQGKQVRVRSGEHPGFTRLVLKVDTSQKWRLEEGPRSARLFIPDQEIQFLVDEVFDRIPRNRLVSLEQERTGAPLEMTFACDCRAKVFTEQGNLLVIDIVKKSEVSDKPFKLPILAPHASLIPVPPFLLQKSGETVIANTVSSASNEGGEDSVSQKFHPAAKPNINQDFERRLVEQIRRGISQDVLTPHQSPSAPFSSEQGQDVLETDSGAVELSNLQVMTVFDRDALSYSADQNNSTEALDCVPPHELNVGNWGSEDEFNTQVGNALENLYGEFDSLEEERVFQLARLYIYFGFGAEARWVLELVESTGRDKALLHAMADALEGKRPGDPNLLVTLRACEAETALWSLLASQNVPEDLDPNQVIQAFSRLPRHLINYLGPRIAEHFTQAEDFETAAQILRIFGRSGDGDQDGAVLVEARLAEATDETEEQEKKLLEVIENDAITEHAAYALVELVEKRWKEDGSVSEAEIEMVAAYAHEFRRSTEAEYFRMAHLLALSLGGEHKKAMLGLFDAKPELESEAWVSGVDRSINLLTRYAGDITFLRFTIGLEQEFLGALSTETAVLVAGRLIDLGFPEMALKFLDRPRDRATRKQRAELIAKATLLSGRPHRALLELQGQNAEQADRVRAVALKKTGAFEDAAVVLQSIGDAEEAERLRWLANISDDTNSTPETEFGDISDLTQSLSANVTHPSTPIAEARSLIEASVDARTAIEELLKATN